MLIRLVTCVYEPEPVVSARMAVDIARRLADDSKGYNVEIIAPFPSKPRGESPPNWTKKRYSSVTEKSIKVTRLWSVFSKTSSLASRFIENLSFGITSSLYILIAPRASVTYLNTWPIIATLLKLVCIRIRGGAVIRSVKDLYPHTLQSQNRLSENSFLFRAVRFVENRCLELSDRNVVISQKFIDEYHLQAMGLHASFSVIPDWNSLDESLATNGCARASQSIVDALFERDLDVWLVYGGNVSRAAGVDFLVRVFSNLASKRVGLIIAGGGTETELIKRLVSDLKLQDRVQFHEEWPKDQTLPLLERATVLMLPTDGAQARYSVPSKFISYLLAGRPVFAWGDSGSQLATTLRSVNCGYYADNAESLELIASELDAFLFAPESDLSSLGDNGRRYALENLTGGRSLEKFCDLIVESASSTEGGTAK